MVMTGKVQLKDGRAVLLRGASPGDVPDIARLLRELSPDSFRARFHGGLATPGLVARLARVNQVPGTVCVVAAPPSELQHLVAEARYVPIGDGVAELAVTVLDRYQRSGLGEVMLDALVGRARDAGIEVLRAVVSLTNGPMLRLLAGYGWTLAEPTDECAIACLEISSAGGMPGWPKDVTGQRILVERRRADRRAPCGRASGAPVQRPGSAHGARMPPDHLGRMPPGGGGRPHRSRAARRRPALRGRHRGPPADVARETALVTARIAGPDSWPGYWPRRARSPARITGQTAFRHTN